MENNELEDDRLDSQIDTNILKERYINLQNRIKYFIDKKSKLADKINEFKYAKSDLLNEVFESVEKETDYQKKIAVADKYINEINNELEDDTILIGKRIQSMQDLKTINELKSLYLEIDSVEREQNEVYDLIKEYNEEYDTLADNYTEKGKSLEELNGYKIGDISEKSLDEQIEMYKDYNIVNNADKEHKDIISQILESDEYKLTDEEIDDDLNKILEENDDLDKEIKKKKTKSARNNKSKKGFFKTITLGLASIAASIAAFSGVKKLLPEPIDIKNDNKKITDSVDKKATKKLDGLKNTNVEELLYEYEDEDRTFEDDFTDTVKVDNLYQKTPKPVEIPTDARVEVLPSDANPSVRVDVQENKELEIEDESSKISKVEEQKKAENNSKTDTKTDEKDIENKVVEKEEDDTIIVVPSVKTDDKQKVESETTKEGNASDKKQNSYYDEMENPYASSEDTLSEISTLSEYLQEKTYTDEQQAKNTIENSNSNVDEIIKNNEKSR